MRRPQAVVALRTQYRMSGDIQRLANTLIYNGRLRCASKSVEEAMLQVDVPQPLRATCPDWLQEVLLSPLPVYLFLSVPGVPFLLNIAEIHALLKAIS